MKKKEELLELFNLERELDLKITEKIFENFFKENNLTYNNNKIVLLFHLALLIEAEIISEEQAYLIIKWNTINSKEIYSSVLWAENIESLRKKIVKENDNKTTEKNKNYEDIDKIIWFFINTLIPDLRKITKSSLSRDMFYSWKINEYLKRKKDKKDEEEEEKRNDNLSFNEWKKLIDLLNNNTDDFILAILWKNKNDTIVENFKKTIEPSSEFMTAKSDYESFERWKSILAIWLMDILSISLLINYWLIEKKKWIAILVAWMLWWNTSSLWSINDQVEKFIKWEIKDKGIIDVLRWTYKIETWEKYASCPFYYSPERNKVLEEVIDIFLKKIIPWMKKYILDNENDKVTKFYSWQLNTNE